MAKITLQTEYQPADVAVFADAKTTIDTLVQPSNFYYDYAVNFNPNANEYCYIRVWYASNVTAKLKEESPCITSPLSDPVVNTWYCRIYKVRDNPWGTPLINGPYTSGSFLTTSINGLGYILEQTVDIDYDGTPIPVIPPDERFFAKLYDRYVLTVGVAANEDSTAVGSPFPYLYATKDYNITLRWTSLRDNTNYSYQLTTLKKQEISEVNFTEQGLGQIAFNYTTSVGNIARGLRMPAAGVYTSALFPTGYENLTDVRSYNEIPLSELVEYMQTQTAGANEQDIFTEIYADFIVSGSVIDTKSVSYSSLFGSDDIDITGGTINDPNGDPSIDDTNVYTDSIELTTPTLTATGVFNRCYVLDGNGVNDLCDYLYNANDSVFDEIIDGVLTRGNPIESLIDLRLYPFDVRAFTGAGTPEFIKFGRTQTTVAASKLPHNANAVISLGSCVVPRYYNSFLDYEMDAKLYIPFCGVCDLPVDRVLNHTISIKLIVDYVTGACCAVVYCDALPIVYQSGVIGVSIPMTATDSAEFGKSIIGNLITGAAQIAQHNPAGAVGQLSDAASKIWNGSDIQTAGASSPQIALFQPKNAYLLLSIVNPPADVYGDVYASTVGYETFMPVSQISWMNGAGFTVFDNVQLNVGQATDAERGEILSLLTSGVFM